jgi:hypothetical protein
MVRPDSIAPNDVQILMPLVSELTARDSLLADPWLGSLADTGCRLCGQGGSAWFRSVKGGSVSVYSLLSAAGGIDGN